MFLKEIGPQNGGQFWTDEKKHTIAAAIFHHFRVHLIENEVEKNKRVSYLF